ncbi:MAG: hypothetical protein KGL69_05075 [Alphaproteobacteria bacterium]|nr:hypothetical protein [Alphaproteobacteria bacterium]
MSASDLAGLLGVVLILVAYALVQLRRLDATSLGGSAMNFTGSTLILLSLVRTFNLSAFIVEAAWALIALYGVVRRLRERSGE